MACARCDFYIPKRSSEAQLLEGKHGAQRMLLEISLTGTERAAAEGDQNATDQLIAHVADAPAPHEPTALSATANRGRGHDRDLAPDPHAPDPENNWRPNRRHGRYSCVCVCACWITGCTAPSART